MSEVSLLAAAVDLLGMVVLSPWLEPLDVAVPFIFFAMVIRKVIKIA
jgi:hypothetical protein